ncbi:lantibiotic immunity ABC transporter MutE/EpiE family permease subunit [Paenibacillus sp. GCM10012306]|uniref:lantibiotic immunity ABC transporter MutE/EpiE family permease subunit n=1 Tax=Paenibacillus sp. GCM10012306 TaxID=3317342 RepID=UPI00361FDE29
MLSYLAAERIKLKRTFARKTVWIMPLLTLLIAFGLMGGPLYQAGVYNWWYVIMLPGALTLFCSLVIQRDARMRFRGVLVLPVNARRIWLGKALVSMLWLLVVNLVLFVGAFLGGELLGQTVAPGQGFFGLMALGVMLAWQIPLCMFLVLKCGLFVTILINLAGNLLLGIMFATRDTWWAVPYAIPIRVMTPILRIQPNGVPAQADNPLLNPAVIVPGILISLALCGLLLWLTALWFCKREVR